VLFRSQARQAASALYHATTAASMAWEAGRMGCARRMRLAQWTLRTRLLPQDPLALDAQPDWLADLLEPAPVPADQALQAVNLLGS
jgi:acyl-CoA dehydrogenase